MPFLGVNKLLIIPLFCFRFYYADERQSNGLPVGGDGVGASTHADMYWNLAHEERQSQWLVTFTKSDGRVLRKPYEGVDFWGETRVDYDRKFGRLDE